ncbi:hypothetical protein ACFL2V_21010 [Pseudomonadota bacterium]
MSESPDITPELNEIESKLVQIVRFYAASFSPEDVNAMENAIVTEPIKQTDAAVLNLVTEVLMANTEINRALEAGIIDEVEVAILKKYPIQERYIKTGELLKEKATD